MIGRASLHARDVGRCASSTARALYVTFSRSVVAADGGHAKQLDVRVADGKENRHGVIVPGIAIQNDLLHHCSSSSSFLGFVSDANAGLLRPCTSTWTNPVDVDRIVCDAFVQMPIS